MSRCKCSPAKPEIVHHIHTNRCHSLTNNLNYSLQVDFELHRVHRRHRIRSLSQISTLSLSCVLSYLASAASFHIFFIIPLTSFDSIMSESESAPTNVATHDDESLTAARKQGMSSRSFLRPLSTKPRVTSPSRVLLCGL